MLLLCFIGSVATQEFQLRLLTNNEQAKCLDGSAPGYYLREGMGESAKNFKIHLCGGGWCSTESSCLSRSNTTLGSSSFWPPVANTDKEHFPGQWDIGLTGLLGNDTNNAFSNWTSVFVMYCDGSSFTSFREEPKEILSYGESTKLWFRGRATLEAVIEDLLGRGMRQAPHVILSGTSAGGMAAFTHTELFRSKLSQDTHLVAVPDAGFWFDSTDILGVRQVRRLLQEAVLFWNTSKVGPNQQCLDKVGGVFAWQCYLGMYLMEGSFISPPVFVVQSLYDPAQYAMTLALPCPNLTKCTVSELKVAEKYRNKLQAEITKAIAILPAQGTGSNGMFLTACNQHEESCRKQDYEGMLVAGTSLERALYTWFLDVSEGNAIDFERSAQTKNHSYVDASWPNNPTCNVGLYHGAC